MGKHHPDLVLLNTIGLQLGEMSCQISNHCNVSASATLYRRRILECSRSARVIDQER